MSRYSAAHARRDLAWMESYGAVTEWEQVEAHPALFAVRPAGGVVVRLLSPEVRVFWRGVIAGARAVRDESPRRVPRVGVG